MKKFLLGSLLLLPSLAAAQDNAFVPVNPAEPSRYYNAASRITQSSYAAADPHTASPSESAGTITSRTTAMQTELDAIGANGNGALPLYPGLYQINTVDIPTLTALVGAGPDSTVIRANTSLGTSAAPVNVIQLKDYDTWAGRYFTGLVTGTGTTLTVTNGVWPSWAASGTVHINGADYEVSTRDSDTQLTLESSLSPAVTSEEYFVNLTGFDEGTASHVGSTITIAGAVSALPAWIADAANTVTFETNNETLTIDTRVSDTVFTTTTTPTAFSAGEKYTIGWLPAAWTNNVQNADDLPLRPLVGEFFLNGGHDNNDDPTNDAGESTLRHGIALAGRGPIIRNVHMSHLPGFGIVTGRGTTSHYGQVERKDGPVEPRIDHCSIRQSFGGVCITGGADGFISELVCGGAIRDQGLLMLSGGAWMVHNYHAFGCDVGLEVGPENGEHHFTGITQAETCRTYGIWVRGGAGTTFDVIKGFDNTGPTLKADTRVEVGTLAIEHDESSEYAVELNSSGCNIESGHIVFGTTGADGILIENDNHLVRLSFGGAGGVNGDVVAWIGDTTTVDDSQISIEGQFLKPGAVVNIENIGSGNTFVITGGTVANPLTVQVEESQATAELDNTFILGPHISVSWGVVLP